jgi:hypothetical protein
MLHPYSRLERSNLQTPLLCLFGAWLLLTPVLVWAMPGRTEFTIPDLAIAGSVDAAREILSHWSSNDRVAFAFILGFDLLYDLVHNNAVALLVAWVAAGRARALVTIGSWLAWSLWAATIANVVENLGFLQMLQAGPAFPWPEVGFVTTIFRNGAIVTGLLFALVAGPLLSAFVRIRAHAV